MLSHTPPRKNGPRCLQPNCRERRSTSDDIGEEDVNAYLGNGGDDADAHADANAGRSEECDTAAQGAEEGPAECSGDCADGSVLCVPDQASDSVSQDIAGVSGFPSCNTGPRGGGGEVDGRGMSPSVLDVPDLHGSRLWVSDRVQIDMADTDRPCLGAGGGGGGARQANDIPGCSQR
jgi:hypothetical protein